MTETLQNIVRIGDDGEIKISLETWENMGVKPGDFIQFYIETGAKNIGLGEYEYIKIIKHPTSILNMPTKEYLELQEKIDRKEIPFKTVDEAIISACKKLLRETVEN